MRGTVRIVLIVLCGVVGGWAGYWIGHTAGWSRDAVWRWTIGGGAGAILLSIGMAVVFVGLAAIAPVSALRREPRRLLRSGTRAQASVIEVEETGAQAWRPGGTRHEVSCQLEVWLPNAEPFRTHTTQFVTDAVEHALQPGATVGIRYDPEDPTHVAIENTLAHAA